jgi:hypothetical protein
LSVNKKTVLVKRLTSFTLRQTCPPVPLYAKASEKERKEEETVKNAVHHIFYYARNASRNASGEYKILGIITGRP